MARILCLLTLAACPSCMGPGPLPDSDRRAPRVEVAPARGQFVERVVRVVVEGLHGVDAKDLALFAGELSDYQLKRIDTGELPDNLVERRIPALTWLDVETKKLTLAPGRVLELGARYTLTAPGYGRLVTIEVAPNLGLPLLERIWPPTAGYGGGFVVLCGESLPASDASVRIDPLGREANFSTHVGRDAFGRACGELLIPGPREPEEFLVLPAEIAGHLVDPRAWQFSQSASFPAAGCAPPHVPLGPACCHVEDDRLTVQAASEPRLWILSSSSGTRVSAVEPGQRLTLRGLRPDSEEHLEGRVIGLGGDEIAFEVDFRTEAPRPHLVLNEVLANALGPEPAAEWIEIVNDGATELDSYGWTLQDSGGEIQLPSALLQSGAYALIVREDFEPSLAGLDVAPEAGVFMIRVPALGKGGLSNTGEGLILTDSKGQFPSRFPALPSKHAGVSVARRQADALDDDVSAFGEHAAPGASPGRRNQLIPSGN